MAGVNYSRPETNTLVKPTDEFHEIEDKVEEAKNDCSQWRSKQERYHRLRMRMRKTKTFPFHGCANLRMPTVETKLRKLKSNLIKVMFGVRPIVQAIPSPSGNPDTARKIEKFVDHLMMDMIKVKQKLVIVTDQTIERGFYLAKPYWRQDITTRVEKYSLDDISMQEAQQLYSMKTTPEMIKQFIMQRFDVDMHDLVAEENEEEVDRCVEEILLGKFKIDCKLQDVLYNFPDVALVNPEFCYVNNDTRWNPQDARMITHEFYLPWDTVKRNVELKDWSASAIKEIDFLRTAPTDNLTENIKDQREGINRLNNPSELVKIWETYTYADLTGDGFQEKCLKTSAPEFRVILRKNVLSSYSMKFPFVKFVNELTDDRWYSHRGMPELIEDLVKEIDTQHNQKLDSGTMRNTPMITYRAGVVNPNLIKLTSTQAIPRQDEDDIKFMQNTNLNADFSYKDEQQILEGKIEELIGQVDFTLQSQINKRQPRTLGEVQLQQQSMQAVFSLDADLYTMALGELCSDVWNLWCEKGDDSYEFSYFGQGKWEKLKLTKEEVQGKYTIVVRGNDQNFNPQDRQQKAQLILQDSYQALQMGLITPVEANNARRLFYQELDVQDWEQYVPQQPPPPPPPPPPDVKVEMDDLTAPEKVQVKQSKGIQPDAQGTARKDARDTRNKNIELITEVMKGDKEPKEPRTK